MTIYKWVWSFCSFILQRPLGSDGWDRSQVLPKDLVPHGGSSQPGEWMELSHNYRRAWFPASLLHQLVVLAATRSTQGSHSRKGLWLGMRRGEVFLFIHELYINLLRISKGSGIVGGGGGEYMGAGMEVTIRVYICTFFVAPFYYLCSVSRGYTYIWQLLCGSTMPICGRTSMHIVRSAGVQRITLVG